MKFKVCALSSIFLFMSINSAIASGWHGHHYNSHHHGHHDSHYYRYESHHYDHYNDHDYGHHNDHNAAYAIGGLIVGGILGATLNNSYNNGPRNNDYRRSNYTAPYTVNNVIRPSYMLQPNGECYLISHVSNGNMVLSPASPRNCD